MGNSYKCNAEEHIQVTKAFSLNVFEVRVQAFQVEGDKFGSGECHQRQHIRLSGV